MKKIINGKVYNTKTAECVASEGKSLHDFYSTTETLYHTKKGAYRRPNMQRFDLVTIYEDPITCRKTEGTAMLIRQWERGAAQGCELWVVRFNAENATHLRQVNVANH